MLVQAENVTKTYARGDELKVEALRGVSLTIDPGQLIAIVGSSGSGKSTLLHCLGALDRPSTGKIVIDGQAIETFGDDALSAFRRRRLGFVFQFFNLVPTLSAIENVMLPALLDGRPAREIQSKAKDLLDLVGLGARANHKPGQLSGGEMQRVAIARAFVNEPALVLADEPTGNLDSKTGLIVLELLSRMVRERGQSVVMVTHDVKAASYGTRLITLKDGRVETDVAQSRA